MERVFQVCLSNRIPEQRELKLPAPYEEVREVYRHLKGGQAARRVEIAEIQTSVPGLREYLQGSRINKQGILELDFLARRMQQMSEVEQEMFEAAAGLEQDLSPLHLINLSYNLRCYSFYPGILTEEALAKHLVDCGRDTMLNGMSQKAMVEYHRQENKGIFTQNGYMERNKNGMIPLYDGKTFPNLHALLPDTTDSLYELRFLRAGWEYALHLPTEERQIHCLEQVLGVKNLDSWPRYYKKEMIQGLREHLPCQITIRELNQFTLSLKPQQIREAEESKVLFAALEAEMPQDITQAIEVAKNLDAYRIIRTKQAGSAKTSLGIVKNNHHPIPALSDEICTVRFFSPLSSHCYGKYRFNGKTEYEDCPVKWDGYCLLDYQETIKRALKKECSWMGKQGLAEFLPNALLKRKVISMMPEIEDWNHTLWGVLNVKSHGKLTDGELQTLIKEWKGQCMDGFGEGFSQREIRIREGVFYVHFCPNAWDFYVKTEQELKGESLDMGIKMGGM